MKLKANWNTKAYKYCAFSLINQDGSVFDGNGFEVNGTGKAAHLLTIHDCQDCMIKNVDFINGNTEALRHIHRDDIPYRDGKCSIYEVIDGGAVVITGKSSVSFVNCRFINNKSIMCGGAVANQSDGQVIFQDCSFENNQAGHTGSAIDNLTVNSEIFVSKCEFKNNKSNIWRRFKSPHGQISIFPNTKATIKDSEFRLGSIPFDFYETSEVIASGNRYENYTNWDESSITKRELLTVLDYIKMIRKMWWIVGKTFGKVYYRVGR